MKIINRVLYQDAEGDIPKAYGTVVGVEEVEKNGKRILYCKIRLWL